MKENLLKKLTKEQLRLILKDNGIEDFQKDNIKKCLSKCLELSYSKIKNSIQLCGIKLNSSK